MLKISFVFEKNQVWNIDHHILQGFFYNLVKDFEKNLHNSRYSLFNFGNIFPYEKWKDYEAGKKYNIYFKSIDSKLLLFVSEKLLTYKNFKFWDNNIKILNTNNNLDNIGSQIIQYIAGSFIFATTLGIIIGSVVYFASKILKKTMNGWFFHFYI